VLTRRLEQTVEELRGREEQLRHLAFHDPLTGLANRALFQDRVEHALAKQPRNTQLIGILFIDLDGFKSVNDRLGHSAGDSLLIAVARRLLGCARRGDTIARLGGDEFAILLDQLQEEVDAAILASRVVDVLSTPVLIDGKRLEISASVGLAVHEAGSGRCGELLRDADIAMYAAKVQGKGGYVAFEPQLRSRITGEQPVLSMRSLVRSEGRHRDPRG
jgi:diguanylate cyclase